MNIEDLPKDVQFMFISMLQCAICSKENGKDKKFFINFASEIWETMLLSDLDYLKDVLHGFMQVNLEKTMKEKKNQHE